MAYDDYGGRDTGRGGRGGHRTREYDDYDGAGPAEPPLPELVKTFVTYLYRHIKEQNVYEIHQMYEGTFSTLTERMFVQTPWPRVEAIAPHVDNDHVFCLLYQELYFRHLYAKLSPSLAQRLESWDNYCNLFNVILTGNVNMQLPNLWLWDMIDEFIYQFQSFCQFRAKMKSRTDEEVEILQRNEQVWNVYGVLNFLQALVEKSEILRILDEDAEGKGTFTASEGYERPGGSNVLTVLGYFSIIGLLRMHCLLGDYQTALQRLNPIDVARPGIFHRVLGCQVTTMYYCGFANMMRRRYVEALRGFNVVLLTILKHRAELEGVPQYEQVWKKNEQMYALMALCLALHSAPPGKLVDEGVVGQLREKFGEKSARMLRGDESAFDELFSLACPKFITPAASLPNPYDGERGNYNQDAYRLQLKLFLADVRQQQLLPAIRSFLKLYTSISLTKLAAFLEIDEPTLRSALLTSKHKSHFVDAEGAVSSSGDLEFYIDEDMVHVPEPRPVRRHGDYFIKHVAKFDEIVTELDHIAVE
eukprot:TRINITY_DN23615_c0_g1_i1.p1 TRINITY_DN23615_c0_g1~~TRINITY_DN23615_c0_g1_i1.p1  ORF type:complete len:531 (+),score=143.46 TRINITY_DN23615_c0_g1_i1:193-1785(+)